MNPADSAISELLDHLAEEFVVRLRAGERPSVDEYASRHPHLADRILRLLRTLTDLEHTPASVPAVVRPVGPPERIGNYRVIREIGRGGMGVVYEAVQEPLGRRVAVKVLGPGGPDQAERFRRESAVAARLHHTNIVPVFEAGQDGDILFYAMQLIPGRGLDRVIAENAGSYVVAPTLDTSVLAAGLTPPDAVPAIPPGSGVNPRDYPRIAAGWAEQAARALAFAHQRGVIHRDVKPSNLLLDPEGVVWVTDFGLVKTADSDLTATGAMVGTFRYLAPERLDGRCDARSDVYALGLTLYELLTGRAAFPQPDAPALLDAVRRLDPPSPRQLNPAVPRDLETVVLKAIRKDSARRYQTAAELAEDLRRFRAGEPVLARRVGAAEQVWSRAKRYPVAATFVGLFVLALFAAVGVSVWSARQANRHAGELRDALTEAVAARADAERSEGGALRSAADAGRAERESGLIAARLTFNEALGLAAEGHVDRALFRFVDALRLTPPGDDTADFRRVVRANIDGWSRHTATLKYAFRVPHDEPPADYAKAARDRSLTRGLLPVGTTGQFLSLGPDGFVRTWDFGTGRAVGAGFRIDPVEGAVSVSPDGRLLGTYSGALRRLPGGDPLPDLIRHVSPRNENPSFTFSMFTSVPGVAATTGFNPSDIGFLRFWDVPARREFPTTVQLDSGDTYHVFPAADGAPVVGVFRRAKRSGERSRAEFRDLRTGEVLPFPVRLATGRDPYIAADGRTVVSLGWDAHHRMFIIHDRDDAVCRWDLSTGEPAATPWQPSVPAWFQILTPDGRVVATRGRDDRVRLFDTATGRRLGGHLTVPGILGPGNTTEVGNGLTLSPDGSTAVTLGHDGTVRGWEVGHLLRLGPDGGSALFPAPDSPTAASLVALSPDGGRAFFALGDIGRVIDTQTGGAVGEVVRHRHLRRAVFSPDGRWLVTATTTSPYPEPPVVRLWDARTGEAKGEVVSPKYIHGVRFSPDGRLLALACVGLTTVMDVGRWETRYTFREKTCAATLAFTPDGERLAVGYQKGWPGVGGGFRVWNLRTGEPVGPFRPDPADTGYKPPELAFVSGRALLLALDQNARTLTVCAGDGSAGAGALSVEQPARFAVSPDGRVVAVARIDGSIELWNPAARAIVRSVPVPHLIRDLTFGPDGRVLMAVCSDDAVRLWDVATGLPLGPPLGHFTPVEAAAVTQDGREIVTTTRAGRVRRWVLPVAVTGDPAAIEEKLERKLGARVRNGSGELQLAIPLGDN